MILESLIWIQRQQAAAIAGLHGCNFAAIHDVRQRVTCSACEAFGRYQHLARRL